MAVIRSEGQLAVLTEPWWPLQRNRGSVNLFGRYYVDYASVYRKQPAVRTVVDFLAKNIAQLGIKPYRRISDTEREHLRDHPAAELLRRPNVRTSRFRFMRSLVSDLAIYDFWASAKMRGPERLELVRLPPSRIELKGDNWLRPDLYVVKGGKKDLELAPEEVVAIHGYAPDDERQGVPPMETLRRILGEDDAASEYREYFWKNRARAEVILKYPGKLSKTAAERVITDWDIRNTGPEASGRTTLLEEGMDAQELTFSARDSQYIESRRLTREEVAAAYHIAPSLVGMIDKAPFASIDAHHRFLYQDALAPWTVWIEEELELQLLPEFEDAENVYFEFNLEEKLKGSFEEQARAAQAAVGAPWLLRNEQRARFNLPPLPGGDEIVTPLNVLLGGQASPIDSAPDELAAVRAVLEKQLHVISSRLGAGDSPDEIYDRDRWLRELTVVVGDVEKAARLNGLIESEIRKVLAAPESTHGLRLLLGGA